MSREKDFHRNKRYTNQEASFEVSCFSFTINGREEAKIQTIFPNGRPCGGSALRSYYRSRPARGQSGSAGLLQWKSQRLYGAAGRRGAAQKLHPRTPPALVCQVTLFPGKSSISKASRMHNQEGCYLGILLLYQIMQISAKISEK